MALLDTGERIFRHDRGWIDHEGDKRRMSDAGVSSVARPLVVIDPEDREQVERLARGWHAHREHAIRWEGLTEADRAESIRTQQTVLRSLLEPERPEEPTGLGAVVEDSRGRRYIRSERHGDAPWDRAGEYVGGFLWSDITAVRVLSEGVRDAD